MQLVELQPAAGVPDRALQLAGRDAGGDQPLQAPGEQLLQLLPHRRLPVLEVRAVAHGEACEEVVPVQADAALQRGGVLTGQQGLELAHVDVDRRGHQPDGRSRDRERLPTAAAATDRVRLSDPRALASSASGHSRSATCSLVCSRPVTASSASSAMAFLVSNVTCAPARLTTGGPSKARLNSFMRSPHPRTALSP